ncbi:MAG: cupin domain-containing protein [Dehalococcoidia bacterium]|nr:cupin domain-containing protein [Dehalococcoidia bacterium]
MKVVRTAEVAEESVNTPLFTGGTVTRQTIVPTEEANNFNCGIVSFGRGARNKFHSHTSDQVLIITSGIGIVATEKEVREVTVGDIIHVPAGEKHWHGARDQSPMAHITITAKGSETTQLEE